MDKNSAAAWQRNEAKHLVRTSFSSKRAGGGHALHGANDAPDSLLNQSVTICPWKVVVLSAVDQQTGDAMSHHPGGLAKNIQVAIDKSAIIHPKLQTLTKPVEAGQAGGGEFRPIRACELAIVRADKERRT